MEQEVAVLAQRGNTQKKALIYVYLVLEALILQKNQENAKHVQQEVFHYKEHLNVLNVL